MYNSFYGEVTFLDKNILYLLVNSIEYEINVPEIYGNSLKIGDCVKIWLFLSHRDDSMKLFGFEDSLQRDFFLKLIKVDGIGPKQAINILSYCDTDTLKSIIDNEDLKSLTKIQGLGEKTGAKIILALRGKLTTKLENVKTLNEFEDIVKALVDMGFPVRQSQTCVAELAKNIDKKSADFEKQLFKAAIIKMSSV